MKNSLSRALSSIPELGEFAQERLTLMVLITNPAALDAVTRVGGKVGVGRAVKLVQAVFYTDLKVLSMGI